MKRGLEREKNLKFDVYTTDLYFTDQQWASFLFQIRTIKNMVPKGGTILEIGIGGGYLRAILTLLGYHVTTFDVNESLLPDRIIDISNCPDDVFDNTYDCVLCAEVLEHIPFDQFSICLDNITRLSNQYVLLTIPNARVIRDGEFRIGSRRYYFSHETKRIKAPAKEHFWELNSSEVCNHQNVGNEIRKYMNIIQDGVVKNNLYHYFYICEKK